MEIAGALSVTSRPFLRFRPMLVSSRLGHCHHYCKSSLEELLHREWMLPSPNVPIHKIALSNKAPLSESGPLSAKFAFLNNQNPSLGASAMRNKEQDLSFYVIRDDLLHPLVNGNKARKLDAVLPILQQFAFTDVVTCGGCQSAHAAAVAVSCAERGIKPHLLLRGEQPEFPTGYNLISLLYGNTTYVPRSLYGKREEMLLRHSSLIAGNHGSVQWVDDVLNEITGFKPHEEFGLQFDNEISTSQAEARKYPRKVVIVKEGAASVLALLGVIRLVSYLSQTHLFGTEQEMELVTDSGTGTTAVGLALGARLLGLPWKITAIMLADTKEGYRKQEKCLLSDFKKAYLLENLGVNDGIVCWVERERPRKFGKVLVGEIQLCKQIAGETGILMDPIYTLAAWEQAVHLSSEAAGRGAKVLMLHTGGTLGMFGLAQRYTSHFHAG